MTDNGTYQEHGYSHSRRPSEESAGGMFCRCGRRLIVHGGRYFHPAIDAQGNLCLGTEVPAMPLCLVCNTRHGVAMACTIPAGWE